MKFLNKISLEPLEGQCKSQQIRIFPCTFLCITNQKAAKYKMNLQKYPLSQVHKQKHMHKYIHKHEWQWYILIMGKICMGLFFWPMPFGNYKKTIIWHKIKAFTTSQSWNQRQRTNNMTMCTYHLLTWGHPSKKKEKEEIEREDKEQESTIVVQKLLNQIHMSHQHSATAVPDQTQSVQSITAQKEI